MYKIAIVTGGSSSELEISLKSAAVVHDNLDKSKYDVFLVVLGKTNWVVKKGGEVIAVIDKGSFTFSYLNNTVTFDLVFMVIHGTPAEDGKLQGYFDTMNIPYTCSSVLASAVTFDKDVCKQILANHDILMAKSVLIHNAKLELRTKVEGLSYPLFVKPNKNGSSYGITKVKHPIDLEKAVEKAFEFDDEVLIEEFVDGRELGCGVFQHKGEIISLPLTEIISENEFFDFEAKYLGKSKEITPAHIADEQVTECQNLAVKIYTILKLSGAVRIDFFLSKNKFYFLEVNTIPGLSAESILPQQAVAGGYSLQEFFGILVDERLSRL